MINLLDDSTLQKLAKIHAQALIEQSDYESAKTQAESELQKIISNNETEKSKRYWELILLFIN